MKLQNSFREGNLYIFSHDWTFMREVSIEVPTIYFDLIWFDISPFYVLFSLDLITQVYRGKELKTAMDSVLARLKREFSTGLFSLTFRVSWMVKTWIKYFFGKWNLYSWVRGRVYCLRFAEGHHRSTCLQWPMCISHCRQVNLWWPGHCQSTCTCLQWLM